MDRDYSDDFDDEEEEIYDDQQIYEEKLSKIDHLMIALSPDGRSLVIFDPRTYYKFNFITCSSLIT
jgi:hypothetical protein